MKKNVFLSIFTVILVLLGLEAMARTYQYFRHDRYQPSTYKQTRFVEINKREFVRVKYDYHPYLLYRLRPSQKFITCGINSLGFRGKEISRKKDIDTYRIAILGGSAVWGTGAVSNDFTIAECLERLLNEFATHKKFEVINAGMSGYIANQERILLEEELLDLGVDMIITFDGFNDVYGPMQGAKNNFPPIFYLEYQERFKNPVKGYIIDDFSSFLSRYSVFFSKVYSKSHILMRNYTLKKSNINEVKLIDVYCDYVNQGYFKNIRLMDSLSRSYGIKAFFMLQPVIAINKPLTVSEKKLLSDEKRNIFLKDYEGYMRKVYAMIIDTGASLRKEGIEFYNLSDIFQNNIQDIYIDRCHFMLEGNTIIARSMLKIIGPFLVKEKLLKE